MSTLSPLSVSRSPSPVTQETQLNRNFAYRGRPATITNAYERAANVAERIAKKVQGSTVAKALQKPGIYAPIGSGAAVTAIASSVPALATGTADIVLWSLGKQICSASPLDTVSRASVAGGALGTLVGMVSPGKVATTMEDAPVETTTALALVGSLVGELAGLIAKGGWSVTDDDSVLCGFAQIPAYNALLTGAFVGAVGGVIGVAAVQGYKFCRSAAEQGDEEQGGVAPQAA